MIKLQVTENEFFALIHALTQTYYREYPEDKEAKQFQALGNKLLKQYRGK